MDAGVTETRAANVANTAGITVGNVDILAERDFVARVLRSLASEQPGPQVVLDFASVDFIDSAQLSTLIAFYKKLRARGAGLTLIHVLPHVYEIFERTRLNRWMDVRPAGSLEAASVPSEEGCCHVPAI